MLILWMCQILAADCGGNVTVSMDPKDADTVIVTIDLDLDCGESYGSGKYELIVENEDGERSTWQKSFSWPKRSENQFTLVQHVNARKHQVIDVGEGKISRCTCPES